MESPYMVFEYMEYGDLAELLRKNDPAFSRGEYEISLKQVIILFDCDVFIYKPLRINRHFY